MTAKNENNSGKGKGRGFASMDAEKQREIASKGGKHPHWVTTPTGVLRPWMPKNNVTSPAKEDRHPIETGIGRGDRGTITTTMSGRRRNKVLIWSAEAKSFP